MLAMSACTIEVDAEDYLEACAPGFLRCNGTAIERCSGSGEGFVLLQECGPAGTCRNRACVEEPDVVGVSDSFIEGDGAIADAAIPDGGAGQDAEADSAPQGEPAWEWIVRAQLLEGVGDAYLDVGLCFGGAPQALDGEHPACTESLFARLTLLEGKAVGTLYRLDAGATALLPLSAEPLEFDPADVVEFIVRELPRGEAPLGESAQFDVRLAAALGGGVRMSVQTLVAPNKGAFGAWNFAADPQSTAALSAVVSGHSVRSRAGVTQSAVEVLEQSIDEGEILKSPKGLPYAELFATNSRLQSLLFPLPIASGP